MKLRWNFRCYPTPEQEQVLARTFGCTRYIYNWGLNQRTQAFQRGERMDYRQSSAALTELKRQPDHLWLNEVSSVPVQQSLRNLQTAFRNFFEKRTRYPTFKKKGGKQSAEYTRSAFSFEVGNQRLLLAKMGRLKVKWSRRVPVEPTTVTISQTACGKYFVSLVVDVEPAPLPKTGQDVGIDFGINRLATLSTGEKVANPRYLDKYRKQLKRAQQSLARKKKGSNRYRLQRQKVAKVYGKITNCRKDTLNKLAWNICTQFDTICVEDLNLRGMTKNHCLARSLNDASIGNAIRTIEIKAAMHGKTVVKIDRWFPSTKTCSICGAINQNLTLKDRRWVCDCGASHDRDVNAAHNILAAGHAVTGRGASVRQH